MNELEWTVRAKRPAPVISDTRPVVLMTAPYHRKADLTREVNRLARRGEVRPQRASSTWNADDGVWQMPVLMLKPPPPAWRRPVAVIAGVIAVLGSVIGLACWVLTSLAAAPLALFLAGVFFGMVVLMRLGKGPNVTINQNVNVR